MTLAALARGQPINNTAWAVAANALLDSWTRRTNAFPTTPIGDPVSLSTTMFNKYATLITPSPPSSNATPAGFTRYTPGGYWKQSAVGVGARDIPECASACRASAVCVAFEVSNYATNPHCYVFNSTAVGLG